MREPKEPRMSEFAISVTTNGMTEKADPPVNLMRNLAVRSV